MAFVPTLDLHEHTLPGLLRRNAERLPDNDCIVAPEFGVCWSWKEFDRRTSEVARGMYAMGIRKGDHVAIWSTNTPEWMLTMFASAKLGAILVTVNTNYKQFELNYLLNQSDTKMLVMTAGVKNNDYISHITGLVPALNTEQPDNISCKQLPFLKRVLLIGDSERRPMGMSRFDDLYEAAKSVPESVVEESIAGLDTHETINMQYTSGTTGFPQGRDAHPLQHYQQRSVFGRLHEADRGGPPAHRSAPVPLLRLRAGRDELPDALHHHRFDGSLQSLARDADPAGSALYRRPRRAHHVHRHAGAPGVRPL